ncbi:putative ATP-dependent DNA helicase Q1 [Dendronephthya gigantea]|uniref:putative ATP-dependent DNA helicase Q1 n=1 Tax=Dendronephthya gigantea TaxID=151771 RepID=UPI00106D399D|nr:putative ATP-dependent DNA helicase Q1 [Dendronephthya gigantea]
MALLNCNQTQFTTKSINVHTRVLQRGFFNPWLYLRTSEVVPVYGLVCPERHKGITLFKQNACISVSQKGKILSKPSELIHPFGPAAHLFSVEDHRFPVGDELPEGTIACLEKRGMVKDLDWARIYERAQSVAKTRDLRRCRKLIAYINKRIEQLPKPIQYRSVFHQFSVLNSLYSNAILKPKQVICLEKLFLGVDILAILPTGYGKSLIYQLLPLMLFAKRALEERTNQQLCTDEVTSVLLVISPLNALINDQVRKLCAIGLRASAINIQPQQNIDDEIDCDVTELEQKTKLIKGYYNLLFAHPEALISSKFGKELVNSAIYQKHVCAIVIDEAHCILEWGDDFRQDYAKLSVLCAVFPKVPLLAMTATANKSDRRQIKESLGLHSCFELIANPNRKNIFYEKTFRYGQDIDAFEHICRPIAVDLLHMKIDFR